MAWYRMCAGMPEHWYSNSYLIGSQTVRQGGGYGGRGFFDEDALKQLKQHQARECQKKLKGDGKRLKRKQKKSNCKPSQVPQLRRQEHRLKWCPALEP